MTGLVQSALLAAIVVVVGAAPAALAADQRLAILDVDGGALPAAQQAKASLAARAGAESAVVDPRISIVDAKAQAAALKRARKCKLGPTLCARDAGKAIGATLVLAARIEKAGKRTRSMMWLVDVDTGAVLAEDALDAAAPKEAAASVQRRAAAVVAAGLRALEPKAAPPPPPPVVEAPAAPVDNFSQTFAAALVGTQGTVAGKVTLTARSLSFEPNEGGLRAWEEVLLKEVVRVEKFNHLMMLPTGVLLVTSSGSTVRLVFSDDRDRVVQLIQSRVDMAKAAAPKPPTGG